MAANISSLKKKRDRAEMSCIKWEKAILHSTKKLRESRRKQRLYTTLIEKALSEKISAPKDPTRIVEV